MRSLKSVTYRVKTVYSSFKALYGLSPEKVDAFVGSFDIYEHDWKDEGKLKEAFGENYYAIVQKKLQDYYSVINHICSLGCVEKMYIPPMLDSSKSLPENQYLFEERMIHDLNIKSGDCVLDIGCGRGRVAAHVAKTSKAQVTGINIDNEQLKYAKKFATEEKMDHLMTFQKADMNDIPFPFKNESFNAVYHIQAFSCSKDLLKLLKEIHRVLKPGGRVSSCDWATLDDYDPKNAEHVKLVNQIKPLLGAIGTPSSKEYIDAFKEAGFKIIKAEVPSVVATDVQNIDKASKEFGMIHSFINLFVKLRIFPKHFTTLLNQLSKNVDTFKEVDERKLATTNFHIVAEK